MPQYVSHLDSRREIKISLKTQDYRDALIRAEIYNDQIESFWKSLIRSGGDNFQKRYLAAVQLAKSYGFAYKSPEQIGASSIEEITERLIADLPLAQKVEALLGGAGESSIMLSDCGELYFNLVNDRLLNKSDHQIKKWKNPRKAALLNFIKIVGNKSLQSIDRSDVISFRGWLNGRIKTGFSPDSANKQLSFVRDILKVVSVNNEIALDTGPLFVETSFYYEPQSRRPFEASYVQKTLLASLSELNERDRHVVYAMADTGAREVELFGLLPEDIRLDEDIPFIWIRPREGYSLKTRTSERKIPLVGSSLYAFKNFPAGFIELGNPDTFSNVVNKYLRSKNLCPTSRHSVYSLRHTFKDRLRDIEAPEEIIDELMGHKKSGPKYGRGHKLETKHRWLQKIAFDPRALK